MSEFNDAWNQTIDAMGCDDEVTDLGAFVTQFVCADHTLEANTSKRTEKLDFEMTRNMDVVLAQVHE